MRILGINAFPTFRNNNPQNQNVNNSLNMHLSQADTNGRWFYDNCSNPSDIVYLDEVQPKADIHDIKIEYFNVRRDENDENTFIPITGTPLVKGDKVFVVNNDGIREFSGVSFKKDNGEIVQKTNYIKGYKTALTEYKDGEEYKLTRYSHYTHTTNQVYYFDASFDLCQRSNASSSIVELQTHNNNGEKIAVNFYAVKRSNDTGRAICSVPDDEEGHKTISLKWTYPNIKYSFEGSKEDAQNLKAALKELKKVIRKSEYRQDFGCNPFINNQLDDAIYYLSGMEKTNS